MLGTHTFALAACSAAASTNELNEQALYTQSLAVVATCMYTTQCSWDYFARGVACDRGGINTEPLTAVVVCFL
jgi:hypothetical protein